MRETGANVLATVTAVKDELVKINEGPAKEQGVKLRYSFDPSHFINQAIEMLSRDLILGILLAVGVLWFFMREWRATLIISAAIPICLFAVIVLLQLTGRTLNVVSLAGLAFATGMVLDAAIVAFENILRLREHGMPARRGGAEGHRPGVGRAARLDRDQRRDLPAGDLPQGRRRSAVRRPFGDDRRRRLHVADRRHHRRADAVGAVPADAAQDSGVRARVARASPTT